MFASESVCTELIEGIFQCKFQKLHCSHWFMMLCVEKWNFKKSSNCWRLGGNETLFFSFHSALQYIPEFVAFFSHSYQLWQVLSKRVQVLLALDCFALMWAVTFYMNSKDLFLSSSENIEISQDLTSKDRASNQRWIS